MPPTLSACIALLISIILGTSPLLGQDANSSFSKNFGVAQFTPNNDYVVIANPNQVRWWLADGSWRLRASCGLETITKYPNGKVALAVSPDNKLLAVAGDRGLILIDNQKKEKIQAVNFEFEGKPLQLRFVGNRQLGLFGSSFRFWTIGKDNQLLDANRKPLDVCFMNCKLSQNGKWLAKLLPNGGKTGTIELWDTETGELSKRVKRKFDEDYFSLLAVTDDGTTIYFEEKTSNTATVKTFNFSTQEIAFFFTLTGRERLVGNFNQVIPYSFSPSCEYIYLICKSLVIDRGQKSLIVYNLKTNQIDQDIPVSDLQKIDAVSPDGTLLLAAKQIIDLRTGVALGKATFPTTFIHNITFLSDSRLFFQSDEWFNMLDLAYLKNETATWLDLKSDRLQQVHRLRGLKPVAHPWQAKICYLLRGRLYFFNPDTKEHKVFTFEEEERIAWASFSSTDSSILVCGSFLDQENRQVDASPAKKDEEELGLARLYPPLTVEHKRPKSQKLIWLDPSTGAVTREIKNWNPSHNSLAISANGRWLATASLNNIAVWDLQNDLKRLHTLAIPENSRMASTGNRLSISSDNKWLAFASQSGGVKIWSLENGSLGYEIPVSEGIFHQALFNPDGQQIALLGTKGFLRLYSFPDLELQQQFFTHPDYIFNFEYSPDGQILLTHAREVARLWNSKSGTLALELKTLNRDGGYMLFNPEGYYVASRGVDEILPRGTYFKGYNFEQYDLIFNRPDKVLSYVPWASGTSIQLLEEIYYSRLRHMGIRENIDKNSEFRVPQTIINKSQIPKTSIRKIISVDVRVIAKSTPVQQLNIVVNGVPVYGKNGISLGQIKNGEVQKKVDIELSKGPNDIIISAQDINGLESLKEAYRCTYTGHAPKPDLHLVAIGISNYDDPAYNLPFARKDALDVVAAFNLNQGNYANVLTYKVLDSDFNLQQLNVINQSLKKSSVDDRIIIFYAGHGILDSDLNYYLSTSQSNWEQPSDGSIPYEELERLFEEVRARYRLIMVDACHSGELNKMAEASLKKRNTKSEKVAFRSNIQKIDQKTDQAVDFELMKAFFTDFRLGIGANVIAAAQGTQAAQSSSDLKNGVFTYYVLQGLVDKKADGNFNGEVTVDELQTFITKKVAEHTQNRQRPTLRREVLNNDWRLY